MQRVQLNNYGQTGGALTLPPPCNPPPQNARRPPPPQTPSGNCTQMTVSPPWAARRSKGAPHMHVLVCICSNVEAVLQANHGDVQECSTSAMRQPFGVGGGGDSLNQISVRGVCSFVLARGGGGAVGLVLTAGADGDSARHAEQRKKCLLVPPEKPDLCVTQNPPSHPAHQAIPLQMHPSAPVWIAT